jgi:hypothetical protein
VCNVNIYIYICKCWSGGGEQMPPKGALFAYDLRATKRSGACETLSNRELIYGI